MLREANPPALLIALDDALRDYALSPERVMDWLSEHGYEIALYDGDRHQIGYGAEPWKRSRTVIAIARADRKSVVQGKRVSVRVDPGGSLIIQKQNHKQS